MKTALLISSIVFLSSCQNISDNSRKVTNEFELDQTLVEEFYRDERLNPDNASIEFYNVENFEIDLNNNNKLDSIILKRAKGWENDPGDFHQIQIKTDNGHTWSETNFYGWVRFDKNYSIPDHVKKLNQIDTDLLLSIDFEKTKIIGLFGWVYASEAGLLTIIEFSTGQPRIMINKNLELIDINNKKIATRYKDDKCWIECLNNKIIMTCE